MRYQTLLFSALFFVTACDNPTTHTPDPQVPEAPNVPPIFLGGDLLTLTTEENNTERLTLVLATDPNGDAITVELSSEDDGDLFTFEEGGLSFTAPPDFENPQDTDMDNVYITNFVATDPAGLQATQTIEITVTDIIDTAGLRRVVTGLNRPVGLIPIPGATRLAVVEQRGRIRLLDPADGTIESVDFLTMTGLATGGEQGLLGLAFAPDFETSGQFYVHLTAEAGGDTEIRRYTTFTGRRDLGDPATEDLILTFDQPAGNHNAGWIGFSNDGFLIVPTGDGGGAGDPQNFAQNTQSLLGKVLRIDVSADDFSGDEARDYAIPNGNAFVDSADGLPEIYALGLRNPFQSSIDPQSGDLLIGEVGQGEREEINRLSLSTGAGTNFGWRIKEGTLDFNVPSDGVPMNLTPPAAEYGHDASDRGGFSVTGGVAYQGTVESLAGQYLFADFVTDNLWTLPTADLGADTIPASEFTVLTLETDEGEAGNVSAFATGPDGSAYVVTLGGDIFEFISID